MIKRKNKDLKDFIWNALGLTLNSFNSLFFLVVVKLINGIDIAGVFTYAFSLCCLFYAANTYYSRTFQVSDRSEKYSFSDYLSTRLILSVACFIAILIFSLISGFETEKIFVILLLMGFKIVEAISDCFYGEIQRQGELYKTGLSLFLKAVVGVIAFATIDIITHNILAAISGVVMVNLAFFGLYDMKNYHSLVKKPINFEKKNIIKILKVCFPVFIVSVLSIFLSGCQKYVLTYFANNEVQAIFGIIIMPATVLSLASAYLINPFVGKLSNFLAEKKYREFKKTSYSLLLAIFGVGVLAILVCSVIGIPVLNFIYQMELGEYLIPLLIIVGASVFTALSSIISNILVVMGKNKVQILFYGITSAVALGLSILLINNDGLNGAVWSFAISCAMLFVLYFGYFVKTLNGIENGKN